jgi:hypothetical protein
MASRRRPRQRGCSGGRNVARFVGSTDAAKDVVARFGRIDRREQSDLGV